MRYDMIDHRRGDHTPPSLARRAQRVLCQVSSPGPAPARTIAAVRRARPLPVQLRFTTAALRTQGGRCTGGLTGNGDSNMQNPPRPCRAGSSFIRRGDGLRPYLV